MQWSDYKVIFYLIYSLLNLAWTVLYTACRHSKTHISWSVSVKKKLKYKKVSFRVVTARGGRQSWGMYIPLTPKGGGSHVLLALHKLGKIGFDFISVSNFVIYVYFPTGERREVLDPIPKYLTIWVSLYVKITTIFNVCTSLLKTENKDKIHCSIDNKPITKTKSPVTPVIFFPF